MSACLLVSDVEAAQWGHVCLPYLALLSSY